MVAAKNLKTSHGSGVGKVMKGESSREMFCCSSFVKKMYGFLKNIKSNFSCRSEKDSIFSNALDSLLLNVKGVAHSEIKPFSFNFLLMYSSRSRMLYFILIKITLCDLHLRFFIFSFSLAMKIIQVSVKRIWIFMMLNPVVFKC